MKRFFALLMSGLFMLCVLGFSACDRGNSGDSNEDKIVSGTEDETGGGNHEENTDGNGNTEGGVHDGEIDEDVEVEITGEALGLSRESGAYEESFTLEVSRAQEGNKIYYTLDGSIPTVHSAELTGGLVIRDISKTYTYPLTNSVVWSPEGYGWYDFNTNNACTVVRLLETDAAGNTVAEKTATYFIRNGGEAYFTLPVISISMPEEDAVSFYNDTVNESKERAEMEYFDFTSGERFALNTQIKLGGNWTKGFPYRTMNVNFNKDENGKKNDPVTVNLFGDRTARNGGELTDFKRFRLHSGGNSQTLSWFGDAFTQRVAAEVSTSKGEYLNLATTGYRPCEVYLNGEYWGLYAIREHYSDVYFEQNYGVDKDEMILLDRAHSISMQDEINEPNVYNAAYSFEVAEDVGDEDGEGMLIATEFFDFLMNTDFSVNANYELLGQKMDLVGLADLVLTELYAGNWDFMYNNIKMWRSASTDPDNPYADGKWRFCLHDLDFSFEFQWGDVGLTGANGYELTVNYLDFYLGQANLEYNGVGTLRNELTCLLTAPMQNAQFRELLRERAKVVQEIYTNARVYEILNEMEKEVEVPMQRHLARWNRYDYDFGSWRYFVQRTRDVLQTRIYMNDNWGNPFYPDGSYFTRQVDATIDRYLRNRR